MNAILKEVLDNKKGMYVHAIEVDSAYELECIIEELAGEFYHHGIEVFSDFIHSLSVYCLDESNEDEVYDFDTQEFINNLNW